MYNLLIDVLKKEGATLIIDDQRVEYKLIFRRIVFMDIKKKFKELEIIYNENCFYLPKSSCIKFLTEGNLNEQDLTEYIRSYITIYKSKDDYAEHKNKLNKNFISNYIDGFEEDLVNGIFSLSTEEYRVLSVSVTWYPIISIIVKFKDNRGKLYFETIVPSIRQLIEGEDKLSKFRRLLINCEFLKLKEDI